MNMYDWNNFIYELQQITYKQNEQIRLLEERITNLEKQIQENASPTIDKIEYHFDQLKIERLDGTLHIGLSPNDLANIDDFGIPTVHTTNSPQPLNQRLIPNLNNFVNEQAPAIIRSLSEKYNKSIDKKLEGDMIHDILGQIPDRIAFYEKEAREKHQLTNSEQLESFIQDQVKKEIYHSLQRFMENSDVHKGEES
ncbi:spore germination protein GerPC [Ornithinibacillus sp. 179-J 7C1 HS]|uniref:spore germination protein GerPC n=1 Tax=Ornithinibacillus sp. 179-J 7C1 HS TaxID=3142384 RepID=UPI0039A28C43